MLSLPHLEAIRFRVGAFSLRGKTLIKVFSEVGLYDFALLSKLAGKHSHRHKDPSLATKPPFDKGAFNL